MPYHLKNKDLEMRIDDPLEGYQSSRFDWTGKVVALDFKGKPLLVSEREDGAHGERMGSGLYNEFGMNSPLGFEETLMGDWFHKIGVGLLRKEEEHYHFGTSYPIQPATFAVAQESNRVVIDCISEQYNGYAYRLKKTFELREQGFLIQYSLENTGDKAILTEEYVHNFVAINQKSIGAAYSLKFRFPLQSACFGETVNPEEKVVIGQDEITFKGALEEEFFFSNLNGSEQVEGQWELMHREENVTIRETTNIPSSLVNLWGKKHVISPEIFIALNIQPGQQKRWERRYQLNRF